MFNCNYCKYSDKKSTEEPCQSCQKEKAAWAYFVLKEPEESADAISRQAAIEKIHRLGLDNDIAIKCDLAIRALPPVIPSRPTESCSDAISRQEVLDLMQLKMSGRELYKAVYDLPPVNPQPKTGHWIDTADEINAKYGKHDYKCSKCGKYAEYFIAGTEDWWSCEKPNYCPCCGAYMVESGEQE